MLIIDGDALRTVNFLNAVKDNWFKLWYLDAENSWQLTTVGKQADLAAAAEVPA